VLAVGCGDDDDTATDTETTEATSSTDNLVEDGLEAQGAGRLDEAREKYLQAIDEDPTNKLAYYNLGVIYQQLNAVDEARQAYERAIEIDSTYKPALFNLAVLESAPDPTRAEALYRRLLELNQEDANVHFNLGLLLRQIGRAEEGNAQIEMALQLDPSLASRLTTTTTAAPPTTTGE
jgi:tetratricopeptide (TPR) repeat protein